MTIKVMQTAHVIIRAGARVTGLIKLLFTPGGGARAGSVTRVRESSNGVDESMK